MRTTTTLLLLLATSLPTLAYADPFAHTWCRLPTPHFEIIGDLKPTRITELALQMEVFRITAADFIHGEAKTAAVPLKVIVFRDRADFRTTMQSPRFSGFMQPSLREGMLVLGPQRANRLLHETALHEYSHYLLRNQIDVSFPVWYDEGLASFLSTMRLTRRHVYIGEVPPYLVAGTTASSMVSLENTVTNQDVYAWPQSELSDFYRMAWALVHFIELGHQAGFKDRRSQLETYLRAVIAPFEETFETSYKALARDLIRYTSRNRLPRLRLPRPPVSMPATEPQCLDDQERDYELAMAMMESNPELARATLAALHAADPAEVRYAVGLSSAHNALEQHQQALEFAERAMTIAPDDPAAQIELAMRLVDGCVLVRVAGCAEKWVRAARLFRSGVRGDPQRFDGVLGLGLSYLHSGRPGDALNYLRVAYRKAPWAPHINFYLGESYRLIGDSRAVVHLTNARNWSTQEIWQRLANAALAELQ